MCGDRDRERESFSGLFGLGSRSKVTKESHSPRPTTFKSLPVANVATLPNTRENITGVPKLRDETLPGLGG